VIGLIDNLLRPKLVGQRAKLHELIIFFAVLGGLQVFGVLGLFVGPVVAAIALALVEVFHRGNQAAAEAEERSENREARSEKGDGTEAIVVAPLGVGAVIAPPAQAGDPAEPVGVSPDRSGGPG
jgi:hypothetical protein